MTKTTTDKRRAFTQEDWIFLILGWGFYTLLCLFSLDHPFFGDCVNLGSRYAHWFLESGFSGIIPPPTVDSGNPPFFGLYIGLWWAVFGRSLAVAHIAMLPFLLGMVWMWHQLTRYFFKGEWLLISLIPLLLEPTLLAQATMLSPDIPLTFFFLTAMVGLLYNNRGLQIVGMCGMPLLSTRGMMTVAVIFVAEVLGGFADKTRRMNWRACFKYVPAGLVAMAWLGYHYQQTGWISYNRSTMPWASSFEVVTPSGYLRNLAILGWRILDFGRVFIWLLAGFLLLRMWRKRRPFDTSLRLLIAYTLAPTLVFLPILARYAGLLQHRYLLQIFLLFGLTVFYTLHYLSINNSTKKILAALITLGLVTGHTWVYPDKISQGWDSTLAHVPYFELRDKLSDFILASNIDPKQVITGTPNQFSYKETNAMNDTWRFTHVDDMNIHQANYVFYSNAFNDIPDDLYDALITDWLEVKRFEKRGIKVILFKRPNNVRS